MWVTERSEGGMATAPHAGAAQSGAQILAEGGTAIEAALAIAATLTVVYPHMTGLGGDSFWLIAAPGKAPLTIDGAGGAGAAVSADWYHSRNMQSVPWRGPLAANTVAGAVSAWMAAWKTNAAWGGRLPLSRVFEDARRLAEQGSTVTASYADAIAQFQSELEQQPGFRELHYINGAPPKLGDTLRQPALSRFFGQLAAQGLDSFYRGELAAQIADELVSAGIPLSADDLSLQQAVVGVPLQVALPMAQVYNCTPPSQGLASLLLLGLFAELEVAEPDSFDHIHGLIESTKLAFAVRDREIGHPLGGSSRLERYLSPAALRSAAQRIDRRHAAAWPASSAGGDTAWFGAMDSAGRAVSAIQSLYFEFGSGVGLPQSGFVWQNRGCAFQLSGSGPNVIGAGRKPFHTLNPAFARFHDGRTMVYGAMGGDGQPQTQAALFTRYAFFGQDLQLAISAPRWVLGRTWRDSNTSLRLESRFPDALVRELSAAGHAVEKVAAFDQAMGHAGAIVHRAGKGFEGASDPRSDGAAVGA